MEIINEKSIANQIRENGYKLLSQVNVTDEDYARLVSYTKTKIKYLYLSSIPHADLLLSLALVQIAIRHYQEGRYWGCFLDEIGMNLPSSKLNYIGQIFTKTIRFYNLLELKRQDNSSQMYVENIKAHAFVTDYYMQGFYDFSYAFFENNLFRELSDDLSDDISDLSIFMNTTLKSNKDVFIADDSGKKAAKSYRLLKSTRAVFAQCQLSTVYALFHPVLMLIDKYYYDDEIPILPQNRYEVQFIEWCQNRQTIERSNHTTRSKTRKVFSHKPYIRVDVEKSLSLLVIPAQKFRSEDCDGNAAVTVTINSYTEKRILELYRSFGIYISEELMIPIPNIFDDIIITINSLSEKKYRFAQTNYRVFNSNWGSISKFSRGHNYLLVKHDIDVRWENKEDVIDQTDAYPQWRYFSANISDESIFYVGNKQISIIGEFSKKPIFESVIEHFSVYDNSGNKLLCVRDHPIVSFVVPRQKMNGTTLIVNENKYFLKNIKEKNVYEWPEDKTKYAINIMLEEILPNEDCSYRVLLDIPGIPTQNLCEYLLLRVFNCRLDKPKYVYDEKGTITIHKAGHTVYYTSEDWALDYETMDNMLISFPLKEEISSVEFSLKTQKDVYTVRIPVYMFKYGFSPSTMTYKKQDYIWYTDWGESLYVKIPGASDLYAYWGKDTNTRCDAEAMDGGMFRIDISELLRIVKQEYKFRIQYINLKYKDGKIRHISLPAILRNIVVNPYFKLSSEGTSVFMDLNFHGKADLFLYVYDNQTKELIIENRRMVLGRNYLPELSTEGFYDLTPFMEESDEFGFDIERTALKPIKGVGCIDLNNLVNCRLQIKEILIDEESLKLEYRYLVHTYERVGEDEYTGAFFRVEIENNKEKWDTRRVFGSAKIHVYQKDEELKFSLNMYSKDEKDWMPPYYDRQRRFILGCDNKLVQSAKDYDRFIPLEEDYTEYIVDMERFRRIK